MGSGEMNHIIRFISSQSQVAAYREMGQQTLGERPCPQVRGGFAILVFFISAGGSQQKFYTLIILLRPSCIIKCLSIVVFFLFGEELKGCLKF